MKRAKKLRTRMRPLQFFHSTTEAAAVAILRTGFVDGEGFFLTSSRHKGVWLSDVPLDTNAGANGSVLLKVTLLSRAEDLDRFEWIEDGKPYREWLIPATRVNARSTIERMPDEDPAA